VKQNVDDGLAVAGRTDYLQRRQPCARAGTLLRSRPQRQATWRHEKRVRALAGGEPDQQADVGKNRRGRRWKLAVSSGPGGGRRPLVERVRTGVVQMVLGAAVGHQSAQVVGGESPTVDRRTEDTSMKLQVDDTKGL
jgi:hypothetical protein